jgi:hypothetical protein
MRIQRLKPNLADALVYAAYAALFLISSVPGACAEKAAYHLQLKSSCKKISIGTSCQILPKPPPMPQPRGLFKISYHAHQCDLRSNVPWTRYCPAA